MNPNGLVEQFIYNPDGTISSKTLGPGGITGTITGQTTTYTYNELKQVTSEKNPDGEVSLFQYNLAGKVSLINLPNGNNIKYTYFQNGAIASEIKSNSANVVAEKNSYSINYRGNIFLRTLGESSNQLKTKYGYDLQNNLERMENQKGDIEFWTYDTLNQLKSHNFSGWDRDVDIKNYDLNGNIVLSKDAANAGSDPLTYRNGDILTKEINSDFGTKTYSYNEADQLTQRLLGTRKCNYNNLDVLGRYYAFVCVASSGTTSGEYQINDNYTYDQSRYGRLDKVTSSIAGLDVNTSYTYDDYDRITKKSQINLLANRWLNTANQNLDVSYTYSTAGKRTSITLPSGRVIGYKHNLSAGILTEINLNNKPLIRSITYDGANRITGWSWGDSGTASYTLSYATNGLLNNITNRNDNAVNYSLIYGYDVDGLITSIAQNNGMKDIFSYDDIKRLTNESRSNGNTSIYSIDYIYSGNGNRTSLKATGVHNQPSADVVYTYNGNKLSTLSKNGIAQALTYTGNAEVAFGPYKATYDNGGRRKVDNGTGHYYYMNYNHKNERNTRGYVVNGAVNNVIQYIYDEESHLIGEYNGTTPIVEYVWLDDKPIAAIYGSGSSTKIYYIVTDHLNTPRRLVDSNNQSIVWSWDSTAFGLGAPTGSVTFNLRFPGQYYDQGTGQFYNHNRFYNPELGRYMEPDPIGLEGGLNPYTYAGNNPVMNTDSSGLVLETLLDAGLAAMSIKAAYDDASWQNIAAATYDTAAVFIPFLPAGAGLGVKASTGVSKAANVAKTTIKIPPTVQNRINVANNATKSTPLRNTGEPVSAGFNHVLDGHFNKPIANNRSVFTIAPGELKSILQAKNTVSSPVTAIPGGQFTRIIDTGKIVGNASINQGGQATRFIKVFTDSKGNLITVYPVGGVR